MSVGAESILLNQRPVYRKVILANCGLLNPESKNVSGTSEMDVWGQLIVYNPTAKYEI
jgi:hypothetical protein